MAAAILKHPRTPPTKNPAVDYPLADSDHISIRTRPIGVFDEVKFIWSYILVSPILVVYYF